MCAIIAGPEDIGWVRTSENSDKTEEQWLNSEVIPALDKHKREVEILINNLHMGALDSRVKAKKQFKVLEYPLVDSTDSLQSCLWQAAYPSQEAVNAQRELVGTTAREVRTSSKSSPRKSES